MTNTPRRRRSEPIGPARPYTGPRAVSCRVRGDKFIVALKDGRTLIVPVAHIPGFDALPRWALARHELVGGGIAIHFPAIDEDVGVANLLSPELVVRPSSLPKVVGVRNGPALREKRRRR